MTCRISDFDDVHEDERIVLLITIDPVTINVRLGKLMVHPDLCGDVLARAALTMASSVVDEDPAERLRLIVETFERVLAENAGPLPRGGHA